MFLSFCVYGNAARLYSFNGGILSNTSFMQFGGRHLCSIILYLAFLALSHNHLQSVQALHDYKGVQSRGLGVIFPQSNGYGFRGQGALIPSYFLTGFGRICLGLHNGNQNRLHHTNKLLVVIKYQCKLWQLVQLVVAIGAKTTF